MSLWEETAAAIRPQDAGTRQAAKARLDSLAMPHWALGRLMDLALELAGMTGSLKPDFSRRVVAVLAGDHGVVAEGVGNYPQAVTQEMLLDFLGGGAGINALAGESRTDIVVADFGVAAVPEAVAAWPAFLSFSVGRGTADFMRGPAMTRGQAVEAVENGIRLARLLIEERGYRVIGLGELGIGNTTPSAAIIAALTGFPPAEVTGRGTGLSDAQLAHKAEVVAEGLRVNRPNPSDGLDVLAKVGGFEIGGLAGLCLGAAARRTPVVMDGLITTAGALIAQALAPRVTDYLVAAHRSVECGHLAALRKLGREPLLDLQLRLGEGTGAAVAMNLIAAAGAILGKMRTFAEAAVETDQRRAGK